MAAENRGHLGWPDLSNPDKPPNFCFCSCVHIHLYPYRRELKGPWDFRRAKGVTSPVMEKSLRFSKYPRFNVDEDRGHNAARVISRRCQMEAEFGTIHRMTEPCRDCQEYGSLQVHDFRRSASLRRMAQHMFLEKGCGMRVSK